MSQLADVNQLAPTKLHQTTPDTMCQSSDGFFGQNTMFIATIRKIGVPSSDPTEFNAKTSTD